MLLYVILVLSVVELALILGRRGRPTMLGTLAVLDQRLQALESRPDVYAKALEAEVNQNIELQTQLGELRFENKVVQSVRAGLLAENLLQKEQIECLSRSIQELERARREP
jgi:hypothetical protein